MSFSKLFFALVFSFLLQAVQVAYALPISSACVVESAADSHCCAIDSSCHCTMDSSNDTSPDLPAFPVSPVTKVSLAPNVGALSLLDADYFPNQTRVEQSAIVDQAPDTAPCLRVVFCSFLI